MDINKDKLQQRARWEEEDESGARSKGRASGGPREDERGAAALWCVVRCD